MEKILGRKLHHGNIRILLLAGESRKVESELAEINTAIRASVQNIREVPVMSHKEDIETAMKLIPSLTTPQISYNLVLVHFHSKEDFEAIE